MSLTNPACKSQYIGNGSGTTFPTGFYFLQNSDVSVSSVTAGLTTTYIQGTDYTITGAGVITGGTITFVIAPVSGLPITIARNSPLTQNTTFVDNDALYAANLELGLDKLTMIAQELESPGGAVARSLQFPPTEPIATSNLLPPIATRPSTLLGFDGTGALASYPLALSATSYSGTSTTTNTIQTGTVTFFTQSGLSFVPGQQVGATPGGFTFMSGPVASYNSATGQLVLNIFATNNSGTYSSWTIYLTGAQGATGAAGSVLLTNSVVSTNQTLTPSITNKTFLCTAALTITVPNSFTLASTWINQVNAIGGSVAIAIYSGDKINFGTTGAGITIPRGYMAQLSTDISGNIFVEMYPAQLGVGTVASATTIDLGLNALDILNITGAATVGSLGSTAQAGQVYTLILGAAITFTYNATSMILPTGASISGVAGDVAQFLCLGSGNWRCIDYQTASGLPLVSSMASSYVTTRQTVSAGPQDANGNPTLFPSTSGSLTLTAQNVSGSAPLVATAAVGFNSSGSVNVTGVTTTNPAWTVTNNQTNYLYFTIAAGVLTPGFTSLAPTYINAGTPSTASGQFTFVISQMTGYMGNGTTAPQANIVFVGEAVASGGTITSTRVYAYNGRYIAPWTATLPAAAAFISFADNLGTREKSSVFEILNTTTDSGFSVGDVTVPYTNTGGFYTSFTPQLQANLTNYKGGTTVFTAVNNLSTGAYTVATAADWSYRVRVSRTF